MHSDDKLQQVSTKALRSTVEENESRGRAKHFANIMLIFQTFPEDLFFVNYLS